MAYIREEASNRPAAVLIMPPIPQASGQLSQPAAARPRPVQAVHAPSTINTHYSHTHACAEQPRQGAHELEWDNGGCFHAGRDGIAVHVQLGVPPHWSETPCCAISNKAPAYSILPPRLRVLDSWRANNISCPAFSSFLLESI